MQPEIRMFCLHALEAGEDIERYTTRLEFDDYESNDMLQAAVERKFEIIGEALNRVRRNAPSVLTAIHDHDRIIGFRNVLAHGYDIIDNHTVWFTVRHRLPRLRTELQALID